MTKATSRARKKKSATSAKRGLQKEFNFELVRQQIQNLVGNQAVDLVESAIAEAEKGHFTAMKYLFEMIGLYPASGQEITPSEDSLALTLLKRLGLPEESERADTKDITADAAGAAMNGLE